MATLRDLHPLRQRLAWARCSRATGSTTPGWASCCCSSPSGPAAYLGQLRDGLIVTNMRDQVSWGFYIGNFTFLVGVAAAAIMLVIPAYIYHWEPIKEIVILGELLAISALVMCLLLRHWWTSAARTGSGTSCPLVGRLNLPTLAAGLGRDRPERLPAAQLVRGHLPALLRLHAASTTMKASCCPLVLLSIPMAVSIHTVTAFLYNGLAARPFWNSAILAPALPGLGLLLGAGHPADPPPDPAQDHQPARSRTRPSSRWPS